MILAVLEKLVLLDSRERQVILVALEILVEPAEQD